MFTLFPFSSHRHAAVAHMAIYPCPWHTQSEFSVAVASLTHFSHPCCGPFKYLPLQPIHLHLSFICPQYSFIFFFVLFNYKSFIEYNLDANEMFPLILVCACGQVIHPGKTRERHWTAGKTDFYLKTSRHKIILWKIAL